MHELTNLVYYGIMYTVVFLVLCIVVTILSGILFAVLKMFFGKRKVVAAESEPGQILKKAKKVEPAVEPSAVAAFARVEPTFGDAPYKVAAIQPLPAVVEDDDDSAAVDEPDASVVERDAAFADRMADTFAAQTVSA